VQNGAAPDLLMDFPDLDEAARIAAAAAESRERDARDKANAALLKALRSFRAGEGAWAHEDLAVWPPSFC
jgi:hypothetical protein